MTWIISFIVGSIPVTILNGMYRATHKKGIFPLWLSAIVWIYSTVAIYMFVY